MAIKLTKSGNPALMTNHKHKGVCNFCKSEYEALRTDLIWKEQERIDLVFGMREVIDVWLEPLSANCSFCGNMGSVDFDRHPIKQE